jgi:hypothetical protein
MNVRTIATAAALSGAMFSLTAVAHDPHAGFAALQGVDVTALSSEEMRAITGQANALDIAAALTAAAAKAGDAAPRLRDALLNLAAYYTANAVNIDAAFARLGILTPCQSCVR